MQQLLLELSTRAWAQRRSVNGDPETGIAKQPPARMSQFRGFSAALVIDQPVRQMYGDDAMKSILAHRPVERPLDRTSRVNVPLSAKELTQLRLSIARR